MNAICADFRLMLYLGPHAFEKITYQSICRRLCGGLFSLPLSVSLICSLSLSAVIAKTPLPGQSATQLEPKLLMALNHPEGRNAALQQLLKLKADTLEQLNERVFDLLEQLCLQHNLSLALRYRALHILLRAGEVRPALKVFFDRARSVNEARPQGDLLLARTLARGWARLGERRHLAPLLNHPDPPLRAAAAAAGAGSLQALCARLKDPWPSVVYQSLKGLRIHGPTAAKCLSPFFHASDERLALAAIRIPGEAGWSTALEGLSHALSLLETASLFSPIEKMRRRDQLLLSLVQGGSTKALIQTLEGTFSAERPLALSLTVFQAVAHLEPERELHWLKRIARTGRPAESRARALERLCLIDRGEVNRALVDAPLPAMMLQTLARRCRRIISQSTDQADLLGDPFEDEEGEPPASLISDDPWRSDESNDGR